MSVFVQHTLTCTVMWETQASPRCFQRGSRSQVLPIKYTLLTDCQQAWAPLEKKTFGQFAPFQADVLAESIQLCFSPRSDCAVLRENAESPRAASLSLWRPQWGANMLMFTTIRKRLNKKVLFGKADETTAQSRCAKLKVYPHRVVCCGHCSEKYCIIHITCLICTWTLSNAVQVSTLLNHSQEKVIRYTRIFLWVFLYEHKADIRKRRWRWAWQLRARLLYSCSVWQNLMASLWHHRNHTEKIKACWANLCMPYSPEL